jgi:hypothetical protein
MSNHAHFKLHIPALGWALSTALVVLFVMSMLAALFVPTRPAHGLLTTIFDAPIDSSRIWVDGIIWALIVGWVIAIVTGAIYNIIVVRRVLHSP